jgi:hypothetical protein
VHADSLSEICQCIKDARTNENHPLYHEGDVVEKLCDALASYQTARGICGSDECPPPSGPACSQLGDSCSPITGESVLIVTGYSCQAVGEALQCVSDCHCQRYFVSGGGKFLVNGAVSMVRLELSGRVSTSEPDPLVDTTDVTGELSAFNYLTRTLVESVSFSSFEATRSGADFSVTGAGTALVNGAATDIEFDASQTGSDTHFEVRDADTSAVLAGGMGEAGRAAFELTVTP